MSSPSLQAKIVKMRAFAPNELPKARLCAQVILSTIEGDEALKSALLALQNEAGRNWSYVHALQYMSGRRGEFAVDCAPTHEKPQMYLAHLVAKQVCSAQSLGAASPPGDIETAKFQALAFAAKAHLK